VIQIRKGNRYCLILHICSGAALYGTLHFPKSRRCQLTTTTVTLSLPPTISPPLRRLG